MAEESKTSELPATITVKADTSKYDALVTLFGKDPDFSKLPLPECIRAKFDIPLQVKEMSIMESTTKALTSRYEYSGFELRDQTGLDISFPPIPETAPPTESNEIVHQESEDHSSPLPSQSAASDKSHELVQQSVFAQ
jgi:hypothetical protein